MSIRLSSYSACKDVLSFSHTEGFDEELSRAIEAQPGPLEEISEGVIGATVPKVM